MPGPTATNRLKRTSLHLFIVSVAATAVVGAGALMMPTGGWLFGLQINILLTTSILTGASVCGLVCGGCYALGHRRIPVVGMLLIGFAAAMGVCGVWAEIHNEGFWKHCFVATTLGVGCSHLAMLLLVRLHRVYAWMHGVAYFLILGLASYVSLLIVLEQADLASLRLIGVMSIAATAVSLVIPVLAYLSRGRDEAAGETAAALRERIGKLRVELAELESRLERLPPPAPASPWDRDGEDTDRHGEEAEDSREESDRHTESDARRVAAAAD